MNFSFDGCLSPSEHMRRDAHLLAHGTEPFVRFYTWPDPSCTYGLFVDPSLLIQEGAFDRFSIQSARRPTGGGLLFHGRDLAFSFFLPNHVQQKPCHFDGEMYQRINETILAAIRPLLKRSFPFPSGGYENESPIPSHFCQAKATQYDVCIGGKKIGGTAERRTRRGLLHQVSLFIEQLDWELLFLVVRDRAAVEDMQKTVISLRESVLDSAFLEIPFLIQILHSALLSLVVQCQTDS